MLCKQDGETIVFRYYLPTGGFGETSFEPRGAMPMIASATGVPNGAPEKLKTKAEAASEASKKAKQDALEAARKKHEDSKRRTWTSADGKSTVDAKFITAVGGVVTLERDDGRQIEVGLDKLSKEDQDFIRERR